MVSAYYQTATYLLMDFIIVHINDVMCLCFIDIYTL